MAETHTATNIPVGRAVGALSCFVFWLTSFFGSIFIHGPVLPIMFLWPWLYRRLAEIAAAMWQALVVVGFIQVCIQFVTSVNTCFILHVCAVSDH